MLKRAFVVTLVGLASLLFGQAKKSPLVLVDGKIAPKNLQIKNNRWVKSSETFTKKLPSELAQYAPYLSGGIVSVTYTEPVYDRMRLAALNRTRALDEATPVLVDGKEFPSDFQIMGDALYNIEIITRDGRKMVSVTTAP